ncbi:MAG: hypothetical protein GY928_25500, partial [Colwellia sp.]|nr:hypothetical protein [Colwellia sp.]
VSTKFTNNHFLNKLKAKSFALSKIDIKTIDLSLNEKISILKTFYLVYTEIFAQILDMNEINNSDINEKHNNLLKTNLTVTINNIKKKINYDPKQFSIFAGIPFPKERWTVLKMGFYFKLKNKPNKSLMHKWYNLPNINNYTLYKQFSDLKNKYCKPMKIMTEQGEITVDPFDHFEKPQHLRPMIIKKQHEDVIKTFHNLHPFNTIDYTRSDYKAFQTFEKKELNHDFVTDEMIMQYRELFYNFNKKGSYCNVCYRQTNKPIEYHLITECTRLYNFRLKYWSKATEEFAEIGSQYGTIHQQLFSQFLIMICRNINNYKT